MEQLLNTLQAGGPVVYLLLVMSAFSICLIIVKALQLSTVMSGAAARDAAYAAVNSGDKPGALTALAQPKSPANRVLIAAIEGLQNNRRRDALTADLEWQGSNEVAGLQRHIRVLELIAMVSPLLGLLGTVLGMIQSFQELALSEGAANAALLADGIWQALLTTAAGLIVAIPAAVAAALFNDRIERATQLIEASVGRLFSAADTAK